MEVFAKHNHHEELLEDSYHHHLSDEIRQADAGKHLRRSVILEKLTSRLKNMRRDNTNFEGCCEGLDPLMFQEVRELVNNFGTSWEEIIRKYNMKQLNEFVNTLDTISDAISNVKNLVSGINSGTTDTQHSSKSLLPIKKQMTTDKEDNDNNEGFDPQMIVEVEELVNTFCTSWEVIMNKYKVKSLAQFTNTLETITEAISNVKALLNGLTGGASESAEMIPQRPLNSEILLSNDEIEYKELEADDFDENDESDFDENEDFKDESNESELNEYETDGPSHVLFSPPNTNRDLNPILNPLSPSLDSFEKEYLDDSAVINDYELAINELNEKIKTLGKDLESANIQSL
ncbi:unnamed protein product [Diamesa hyperborea]